jgi:hypothetical protein
MEPHRGILISRIPVDGLGGFIVTLGTMAIIVLAVPQLRLLAAVCLAGGVLVAPLLRLRGH